MDYIVYKRFRQGDVNLPAMTECESKGNVIFCRGKEICAVASANAHQYFARNDDGRGMERGALAQAIQKALRTNKDPRTDKAYQAKWDKVWGDALCQKYKRTEHADHWLWNHEFFNAPIEDLRYISALVGAKGG